MREGSLRVIVIQEEMMGVLSNLEPNRVFHFFEEMTKIPHGSGNVEQISDWLVKFAKDRNLFYVQDELKNVIIVKEATPGYEAEPAVILQGHMDMVAVKKPNCDINMRTEGLRLAVKGDEIYAEGTSLGGDDGIAVAYALALLDSDNLKHPKLEVIITVDEEVGMDGARAIDLSMLTGNRMINLDSEEEGIFLTSCAGGARVKCKLALNSHAVCGTAMEITVGGLLGGHSGAEIHKERGNSNCLMARVLYHLVGEMSLNLSKLKGGLADNAIPRETKAVVVIDKGNVNKLQEIVAVLEQEIQGELSGKDSGVFVRAEVCDCAKNVQNAVADSDATDIYSCADVVDTKRAVAFLLGLPNGVQAMSGDMPGLVETSLNMGVLEYEDNVLLAEFSVRSSVESAKNALIDKMFAITTLAGGTNEVTGDYPGWKYRKDSPLRDKMIAVYERMYGTTPKVEAIHAGLECGILGSKIKDLDCVSIGPDMKDIHTTEETLSISSTARVWEYLVELLAEK